jgi:hypothetical protein
MRVCRQCQAVNGDSDTRCRVCGTAIGGQLCLPPRTPVARPVPDMPARRNRNALLLLILAPLLAVLMYLFWDAFLLRTLREVEAARRQAMTARLGTLRDALSRCKRDTGGVPVRLEGLRQFVAAPADLTPGADPGRWRGPYLPTTQPFPENPYRPRDGARGWHYTVEGDAGAVTPIGAR